ncbi:hypothetical protein [Chryseobacterium sp. T1]
MAFSQATYYVKATASGNGSSWDNPISIASLLSTWNGKIPMSGITVYLAQGNYFTNINMEYAGGKFLMQGGFPANATGTDITGYSPSNTTTITRSPGAGLRRIFEGSYTGTVSTNEFTIKGLTLINPNSTMGSIFYRSFTTAKINFSMTECTVKNSSSNAEGLLSFTSHSGCKYLFEKNTFTSNQPYNGTLFFSTDSGSEIIINNNKFNDINTGANGGALYLSSVNGIGSLSGSIAFTNNIVTNIKTRADGGALYLSTINTSSSSNSTLKISNNIFSCISGANNGGAIYLTNANNINIEKNQFLGNSAVLYGGAVYLTSSGVQFIQNIFIRNTANKERGGALFLTSPRNSSIEKNLFLENSSTGTKGGGAVSLASGGDPTLIDHNIFIGNNAKSNTSASNDGGAVFSEESSTSNTIGGISNFTKNLFFGNTLNGGTAQSQGADIGFQFSNAIKGSMSGNYLQLAQNVYDTKVSKYFSSGSNTFSNTDNRGVGIGEIKIDCTGNPYTCVKSPNTTGTTTPSKIGISTVSQQTENWPQSINGGALVLDSKEKGLVITRVDNVTSLGTDASLKGSLVYDKSSKCFKFFDGTKWDCITQTCDTDLNQIILDYVAFNP